MGHSVHLSHPEPTVGAAEVRNIHTLPIGCKKCRFMVDGQPKLWQKEYWGSRRWQKSYNRRTYVEGAFGNLKNASGENVSRGFFRVSGQARVTLLLGIAVTAHNMRQVRNWHERTGNGDPSHPLFAADSTTLQVHMTLEEYEILQTFRNSGKELEAPMEETADAGFGEAA